MAEFDLNALNRDELKDLRKKVDKAISDYDDRRRREARAAVEAKVREMGFTLSDLAIDRTGKTRAQNPPKYRHPENPSLTWSGRGRQPRWIKEAVENGSSLDDFLIEPAR